MWSYILDYILDSYILEPMVSIIIPLFLAAFGCVVTYTQVQEFLVKKYGSFSVANEIMRVQSFEDKILLNIPKRHIGEHWKEYKKTQVCAWVFRIDFFITALILLLGSKELWLPPRDGFNRILLVIAGIKAVLFEVALLAYMLFGILNTVGFVQIYCDLENAESDIKYAHKKLDRLHRKVMTPKR